MQSNGFRGFVNAGGLNTKEDLKSQINSIAERIARAKEIKGVLCLNNGITRRRLVFNKSFKYKSNGIKRMHGDMFK